MKITNLCKFVLLVCLLGSCNLADAQISNNSTATVEANAITGPHSGSDENFQLAFSQEFKAGHVPWVQVNFGEYDLGDTSFVQITSLKNQDQQTLDAIAMENWNGSSGMFQGGVVLVELFVAASDEGVMLEIDGLTHGHFGGPPETLCDGDDDRIPSTDPRVGRHAGNCTAFLVSNGSVLTAGHCPSSGIVEFNVPQSLSDGTLVPAAIEDQYPVTTEYGMFWDDGDDINGRDWRVMSLGPNSQTGLRAHVAQGFFRCTTNLPLIDGTIRITGCGSDETPLTRNQTLQTDLGPFEGEGVSGNGLYLRYRTDTEPANSGSPVIWNQHDIVIGIHTNGGCNQFTSSANLGTSFELNELENAINGYWGNSVEQVDGSQPPLLFPNGSIMQPWFFVENGINAVSTGGTVVIVEGSYDEMVTVNRAMTLRAPVGTVTIGR